ncbi:TetR/AcrR family transcriptional regulator [Nocardia sp. NBC_00508]|uniref:TetR/AcrR family transcriptional regulator n=1 Tax=Nocardia sp. NBC_00508 TaxID=2975992 RepID=UPI002E7FE709|nr:TetR/AcrR family transcriptional regulator [Nocardia sp. NBC_00508]WUD64411.1 TetR/AcrR family transcriptional regulator [Nocardia sp. NBC_00508]
MTTQTRKERERAERRQRIVDTARELAEAQGWESVTVRRLAERIEYSQPVLYSHFVGKSAIVSAVAVQGFAELTTVVRQAHAEATGDADRLRRVARAYLEFAAANPALYDAMFLMSTDLTFGLEAPLPLREGFAELEAMFRPLVDDPDLGARTEVAWSTLHGLATLERGGRLRPELRDQRLDLLVAEWLAAVGAD